MAARIRRNVSERVLYLVVHLAGGAVDEACGESGEERLERELVVRLLGGEVRQVDIDHAISV
jgi:hypothetical protein